MSGCSFWTGMFTLRITPGAVTPTRLIEVDDEPDPAARDPHADSDAVVLGVHQVDVMAAAVRLLALEEEMRAEDGGRWIAGATAEVLGPDVARVTGAPESIAGCAADEVVADVPRGQQLGVRSADPRRDRRVDPESGNSPTAGAA